MIELTKEEVVVAHKIIQAVHDLPCSLDEFAGLTDEECGWDAEADDQLDDCPLWRLEKKLREIANA